MLLHCKAFRLILFRTSAIVHRVHIGLYLLLDCLMKAPARGKLHPDHSNVRESATLSRVMAMMVHDQPHVPFRNNSSAILQSGQRRRVITIRLRAKIYMRNFRPFGFHLFCLHLVPMVHCRQAILFNYFCVMVREAFLCLLPVQVRPGWAGYGKWWWSIRVLLLDFQRG